MNLPPNILLFAPTSRGGLAEYTFYQATALAKAGDVGELSSKNGR